MEVKAVKIAAGGLQAYATQDDVAKRQGEEIRKPDYTQKPVQDSDSITALNKDALNKTVERLNDASQAFDLPLRFERKQTDHGKDFIEMRNDNNGKTKPIDIEHAEELINKIYTSKGINLDYYI